MFIQNFLQNLIPWLLSSGVKIVVILIAVVLTDRFLKTLLKRIIGKQIKNRVNGEKKKRADTLISILSGTSSFIIWVVAILMILPEFGINIAPILAGMGLLGLAVGMAARDIISDFISGFFIVLENQYHVGDEVKISGIEGEIKEITLRRTVIKDKTGLIHLVPNGQIKTVAKKQE